MSRALRLWARYVKRHQNAAALTGRRWGTKQSFAANLLARLRTYADDSRRFMTDSRVPFTQNLAEHALQMSKVKQKVAHSFRTPKSLATFATIRSFLASRHR